MMTMELGLRNKRALVLGASGGLGGAVARALAADGASVLGAARQPPAEAGAGIEWIRLDLSDRASVDAVCDSVLARGGVDILVNNSGGPPPSEAKDSRYEDWTTQFATMAASLFHLTGRLLPPMLERGWGRVISIASSGVEQPLPRLALSNGVRSAVLGWSKTLASEVAAQGVTVNMVLPGRIRTKRVNQLDEAAAKRLGVSIEQVEQGSCATIPIGRYGRPEEFGGVVAFLASEPASYITGSVIRVDGGLIRSV
jgi:3-oxoacyl-[acyl-carrier protein] reductase